MSPAPFLLLGATEHKLKRRFQFTLRMLLIGIAVIAVVTAWYGLQRNESRRQAMAIRNIEKALKCPVIVRKFSGVEGARFVDDLNLSACHLTDTQLSQIAPDLLELTHLGSLNLREARITDESLVHIEKLHSLQDLNLSSTKISDVGLKRLSSLKGLQVLDLRGTNITNDGVAALTKLRSLRNLDVGETKITFMGAQALKKALPETDLIWGRADLPSR